MPEFIVNSFQVPNALVDQSLAEMSDSALRMYLIIVRKTRGWQKESDRISLTQFETIGKRSRHTVIAGLAELERLGMIQKSDTDKGSVWTLNDGDASAKSAPVTCSAKSALVQNMHQPSAKYAPVASAKSAHTENNSIKTTIQKTKSITPTPSDMLKELGCDDQLTADFIAHRKAKKATITQTALNLIVSQAAKAGISFSRAVEITIERNWVSFNASWKWQDDKRPTTQATWADQQNEKWGAFFDGTTNPPPKTVGSDNVIPFAALEVRHG